jgi:hypothetical protein
VSRLLARHGAITRVTPVPVLIPAGATSNGQSLAAAATWETGVNMVERIGFTGTVIDSNRLVMSASGNITVTGRVQFQGATTGIRGFRILKNGTVVYTRDSSFGVAQDFIDGTSPEIAVLAGDFIGVEFFHHSGNASTRTVVGGDAQTYFYTLVSGVASVPSQVTGLTATPSGSTMGLNWSAPSNGGSPITDYTVQYKLSSIGTWSTFSDSISSTPSAVVTALTANTSYDFRVAAVNSVGQGAFSSTVTETTPAAGVGTVIWQDTFDTTANGQLVKTTGDSIFAPTSTGTDSGTYANGSIVDDSPNGKFLRQNIPANSLGAFIVTPLNDHETDWASLEFEIRFDPNFDWQWGGKLGPGLHGVAPGHAWDEPSSCQLRTGASFSTRLMWHGNNTNGTGSGRPYPSKLPAIPAGSNDIVTYAYVFTPSVGFNNCGWHTSLGALSKGAWHTIKQEVKLNAVGSSNGIFRLWIDGVLKLDRSDWIYRTQSDLHIQGLLWDVHRGGGLPDWGSPIACQIDHRNVVVTDLE